MDKIRRSLASMYQPILGIHTLEGRYIYVHEDSFAREGLSPNDFLDVKWQNFALPEHIDAEQKAVSNLERTGDVSLYNLNRKWPRRNVVLTSKLSLIKSKGGTALVLREGYIAGDGPQFIDLLRDAKTPFGRAHTLDEMADQLKSLIGLADREGLAFLRYLLDMAREQTAAERAKILKEALS